MHDCVLSTLIDIHWKHIVPDIGEHTLKRNYGKKSCYYEAI